MIDYHVHTRFSGDSLAEPAEQLSAALQRHIDELCFTDHIDFDNPGGNFEPADLFARHDTIKKFAGRYTNAAFPGASVRIKEGAEISMAVFPECREKTLAHIGAFEPDFIIGSVHCVDMNDVYYPEYHAGKTKAEAYLPYLETILACLPDYDFISVLGHYDFVAKCAPYADRTMSLSLSPRIAECFEAIFRTLVSMGKGVEINTAAWRDAPHWGLDILRLYRECGGEFVTFGSDAHRPTAVGNRLDEAKALAIAAGIPCYATFTKLRPELHKLEA